MQFHIPIRLVSLANARMHWRRMSKVKQQHRLATFLYMKKAINEGGALPPMPLVVTITRIGKRKLDSDNLQSACKYVRDQIAEIVGVDDGSCSYTWRYEQRIGEYGVGVSLDTRF